MGKSAKIFKINKALLNKAGGRELQPNDTLGPNGKTFESLLKDHCKMMRNRMDEMILAELEKQIQ